MNVSDYQIHAVIKTYIKSMRGKVDLKKAAGELPGKGGDDLVADEGMKRMVFDRIGEIVTEKLKRHEA